MHHRRPRLQRDVLAAGIDQVEIFLTRRCDRTVADHAILRMVDDVAIADVGVGTHRRNADTEVDDPAILEFECDAVCHLLAVQTFGRSAHRRRSCLRVGHNPSGAGGTFTSRCTKMPGVCTWSGSIAPAGTMSSSTSAIVMRAAVAITGQKLRCDAMELQVAERVRARGAHERVIQRQRVFQQVFAPVDHPRLASGSEFRADGGWRVECRDAGPGSAHAFRERALRHQLCIDFTGLVVFGERNHVGGAR